ncbi:MAG: 2OG-Fe(II) oxygenase [Pseudomarimonas sp.]
MLAATTLQTLDADASAFAGSRPFRHTVIDGFFDPAVCAGMLEEFPGFDTRYAVNELGEVGGKAVRSSVAELGPTYAQVDRYIQSPAFLDYVSRLTGIPDLLYDPDYEGGGTHENRDGQGLEVHIDFNYHPRTGFHRRLNLIVYLNPEWDAGWGGELRLVEDPWSGIGSTHAVAPLFNRCVVFETNEVSWHGFQQIRLPPERAEVTRKSFAIYLYTRERPVAETAPPHATIYVPAGMPAELMVGSTLDEESHMDLRVRFARLRGQLRFLYARETEFSQQVARLKHALDAAVSAQRVDLQGYAKVESVSGVWADGWVSDQLLVSFTPTRSVRGLSIDLWVPPQLLAAQSLTVSCAGVVCDAMVAAGARKSLKQSLRLEAGATVTLSMDAESSWQPAASGSGGDERPLAWRLLGITLEH